MSPPSFSWPASEAGHASLLNLSRVEPEPMVQHRATESASGLHVQKDEDRNASGTVGAPLSSAPSAARLALIIDDESTIRAALGRYFTRRGWTVEEAADGRTGLALVEQHVDRIGVVISDLRMPGFSGIELHDRLASERPDLLRRFIFSTGDVASSEAASFVQRTACPVLQKPFELRALDDIVSGVLEGVEVRRVIP
jgi:CheY-like chemotaxis protein